jgi:hypothetical protein
MPKESIYEVREKQRDSSESIMERAMEDFRMKEASLWNIPK